MRAKSNILARHGHCENERFVVFLPTQNVFSFESQNNSQMHLIAGVMGCSFGYSEKHRVRPDTPFSVAFHKCALIISLEICAHIFCPCLPIRKTTISGYVRA